MPRRLTLGTFPAIKLYRNLLHDASKEQNKTLKILFIREAALLLRTMSEAELNEVENLAGEGSL